MARNRLLSALLLYPISRLYGLGVALRNKLFEQGMLKQQEFKVPVVVAVSYTHLTLPTKRIV